eukprot:COSAG06_NODE_5441_length_3481_cov_2.764932_1_plen_298_part_00
MSAPSPSWYAFLNKAIEIAQKRWEFRACWSSKAPLSHVATCGCPWSRTSLRRNAKQRQQKQQKQQQQQRQGSAASKPFGSGFLLCVFASEPVLANQINPRVSYHQAENRSSKGRKTRQDKTRFSHLHSSFAAPTPPPPPPVGAGAAAAAAAAASTTGGGLGTGAGGTAPAAATSGATAGTAVAAGVAAAAVAAAVDLVLRLPCWCHCLPASDSSYSKTPPFSQLSLCLSRACLGKTIIFTIKWRKKAAFSYLLIPWDGPVRVDLLRMVLAPPLTALAACSEEYVLEADDETSAIRVS